MASSYDAIYDRYVQWGGGHAERRRQSVDGLFGAGLVVPGATALDLGCGTGQLATAYLVEKGLRVTGVDISVSSIAVAQRAIPGAEFIAADMAELDLPGSSFDLVTAFYSIIHLPRQLQPRLFVAIFGWLRPGGVLVASLAARASENFAEDWLGAPMYWSSWDADTNEQLVRQAGLDVLSIDVETDIEDGIEVSFQWVVARKPPAD